MVSTGCMMQPREDLLKAGEHCPHLTLKRHGFPQAPTFRSLPALSPSLVLLFASACGLSVANIYAAQPLLDQIAYEFGVSSASIGIVVTVTLVGYALGLL